MDLILKALKMDGNLTLYHNPLICDETISFVQSLSEET